MEQSQEYIQAFEKTKEHKLDVMCGNNNIQSITCGDEFVVMLLADNSIIISPCPSFLETSFIPEQIDKNVISISCGVSHITALLTNSKKLYIRMLSLVTLSRKENDFFDYKKVGYNYRMPSVNAALGIGQIDELENFIKSRNYLYRIYKKLFKGSDIKIFKEPKFCRSNYWLQIVFIKKN